MHADAHHQKGEHHSDNRADRRQHQEGPERHPQYSGRHIYRERRQDRRRAQEEKDDLVVPDTLESLIDPLDIGPGETQVFLEFVDGRLAAEISQSVKRERAQRAAQPHRQGHKDQEFRHEGEGKSGFKEKELSGQNQSERENADDVVYKRNEEKRPDALYARLKNDRLRHFDKFEREFHNL